jgi:hypothetical protein
MLAAAVAVGALGLALAQEGGAAAAVPQAIKVPVKQYTNLTAADVYRLATSSVQANVRFKDAFGGERVVPGVLSSVNLDGITYVIARAFRTQGNLVCLVPQSNIEALRALLGVPAQWPFTQAALGEPVVVNRGQQITVEGCVIGAATGESYVLVDALLLGGETRGRTSREAHLFWDAAAEARVLTAPGTQSLSFPCTYVPGKTDTLVVTIRELKSDELRAELARLAGQTAGLAGGVKMYGEYPAMAVYRMASENRVEDVDFTDTVVNVADSDLPAALSTAPTRLAGTAVDLPISYRFDTANRITCLVLAGTPTLTNEAGRLLPGQKLRVRGTTIGRRGLANCVLVDYVGLAESEQAPGGESVWFVSIQSPEGGRQVLWDYGLYSMPDVPCQNAPGRLEALRVLISEFRSIPIQPPAAPAPQPAAQAAPTP